MFAVFLYVARVIALYLFLFHTGQICVEHYVHLKNGSKNKKYKYNNCTVVHWVTSVNVL